MLKLFSTFFAGKVLAQGINFLSTIILIAYLSTEDFGRYSFTLELVMLFSALLEIGSRSVYIREISSSRRDFQSILTLHFLLIIIFLIISGTFLFLFRTIDYYFTFLIMLLALASSIQVPFIASLISKREAYQVSKIEVFISIGKLIFFSTLVLLGFSWDFFLFFFLIILVVFYTVAYDSISITFLAIKTTTIKELFFNKNIKIVLPMMLIALMSLLYNKIDIFMLEIFLGFQSVGEYAVIYRLILPFMFVSSSLFMVLLPSFADSSLPGKSMIKIAFLMFFVGFILSIAISSMFWLVSDMFFEKYAYLLNDFILYSFYLPLVFSYGVMSNFLVSKGQERVIFGVTIIALMFNVLFNFILIPKLGVKGAILSTIFSEMLILLIYCFFFFTNKFERYD